MDIRKPIIAIAGAAAITLAAVGVTSGQSADFPGYLSVAPEGCDAVSSWWGISPTAWGYRLGWVNMREYRQVTADFPNASWLSTFSFRDIRTGPSDYLDLPDGAIVDAEGPALWGLNPADEYAFILGEIPHRFGAATSWSEWQYIEPRQGQGFEACVPWGRHRGGLDVDPQQASVGQMILLRLQVGDSRFHGANLERIVIEGSRVYQLNEQSEVILEQVAPYTATSVNSGGQADLAFILPATVDGHAVAGRIQIIASWRHHKAGSVVGEAWLNVTQ